MSNYDEGGALHQGLVEVTADKAEIVLTEEQWAELQAKLDSLEEDVKSLKEQMDE